MSTLKPAKTSVTASAATRPSVKAQVVRQDTAKKPVVKKPAAAKPASKKISTTKTRDFKPSVKKAAVKKPVAKTLLSKVFANAKLEKAAKTTKVVKPGKARKPKLVRDSFTIPKVEYVVLEALKQRATRLNRPVKKSELLRAGIKVLATMHDAAFLTALERVPTIKTARPAAEAVAYPQSS